MRTSLDHTPPAASGTVAGMTEEIAGIVIGGLGLLATAGACFWVRHAHLGGSLSRNEVIGVRTKATTRSDAAWKAGHDAAAPWLLVTSWVGLFMGAATIVIGAVGGKSADVTATILLISGFTAVLVLVALAGWYGDRAARQVDEPARADTP